MESDNWDKKKEFIEAVYFNGTKGFRSISETAKQANILSKPEGIRITQADVRRWKERENPRKKQLPGYNSFIVNGPYQEFQVDLLFFTEQGQPENKYKAEENMEQESGPRRKKYVPAVICVDTFSKYAALEVLHRGKTAASVKDGLKSVFQDMGSFNRNLRPIKKKMPHTVYSDQEPALISNELQKDFFKKYNIRHLTTLAHAPVAERTIRTIKAIYEDMKLHRESVAEFTGIHWHGLLHRAVEAYNDHIHRATGMTPEAARNPENTQQAKQSLEHNRVSTRHYPSLNVGDEVRLYKKKDALDKERVPLWSDNIYKVTAIKTEFDQTFYKINNNKKQYYMRSELLKIE